MNPQLRVILLFVDGLGLGPPDPAVNPVLSGACPHLEQLLREQAVPIDPCMGVPGFPQSATGQTALLTGVNAAQAMGRHVEGFPGGELRNIIRERSLFAQMRQRGLTSTFANAYFVCDSSEVREAALQSVTTVAALSAFGRVRDRSDLERNEAVYQDLTREGLRPRGYRGPLITPAQAAEHLAAIARHYPLTLFEYFQTDRAGHGRDWLRAQQVLGQFDAFLATLLDRQAEAGYLLVLTSDHGNIEDLAAKGHTLNPIPFAALGPGAEGLKSRVRAITDVTPALLSLWGPEEA
jgi:hypothetical protein